jgi:arginyl-tRNA synthetase
MRDTIIKVLRKVTEAQEIDLSIPENSEHGDYSTNIAFKVTSEKFKGNTPREVAEQIIENLNKEKELKEIISKIEVADPGFINFFISKDALINNLIQILDYKEKYGKTTSNKGKLAIIEYSSPNIAKPFTIGHLRSTIIGDAIANLMEATGWTVLRDNHLGDWGTQFGKQIYAIKAWGNEEEISKSDNPVEDLVGLYVKFHEEAEKDSTIEDKAREWFKKLEDGDPEARRLWKKCVEWSWKEFNRIYNLLEVSFSDEFDNGKGLGESFFEDKMTDVINELEEKGLLKTGDEGAKLVFFEKDKYPPAMILKKDGATLYHTRDLATDKYRKVHFDPDMVINEVGSEQSLYFQQLFEMERMLGWFNKDQRKHIAHGLIRFKEGKMSTRKGNVIWLTKVLEMALKKAYDFSKADMDEKSNYTLSEEEAWELAQKVGIGALKWNDLKRDPLQNIAFDWDEVLNMQGNSGPYLQYTYARAKSILEKAGFSGTNFELQVSSFSQEEEVVLRRLSQFSVIIENAAKIYSPNVLCNYLYELARQFNGFYNKQKVIGSEKEAFRLGLTASVAQVLKNGLELLGIQAPNKM